MSLRVAAFQVLFRFRESTHSQSLSLGRQLQRRLVAVTVGLCSLGFWCIATVVDLDSEYRWFITRWLAGVEVGGAEGYRI